MEILAKAVQQFEAGLPFVLYNKPNSDKLIGLFQKDAILHHVSDFKETGFILAPFSGEAIVLIPEMASEVWVADFTPTEIPIVTTRHYSADNQAQPDYEQRVNDAINAINNGRFEKLVLSRAEILEVPNFNFRVIFERLLNQYPTAFTYCFFHPEVGFWFGAFAEQLLQINGSHFKTMAVAGTQPFQENFKWGEKEKMEQQFVTDFIVDKLKNQSSELQVSKPYTLKAGTVMHIKTDIEGTLKAGFGLREMIHTLHPTPAVCGLPKIAAQQYILKHEGYDREYYSGFFGEFNKDFSNDSQASDLYVNLRCMQIRGNKATLYVGGGITKDSIPANEWLETVNKTLTMKRILDPQTRL